MRNKLFDDLPKSVKVSSGKWVQILPDKGEGYALYNPLTEKELGRLLFDASDNWVYDGDVLTVDEQEELAGKIAGHQKEMDELLNTLKEDNGTA
jgi:hypothetical protein